LIVENARLRPDVAALLAEHGITAVETPIEHDGYSGARMSRFEQDGQQYLLKRVTMANDWIMRGLDDCTCREAEFAVSRVASRLPETVRLPYLGAARDGDGWAILSRDISPLLFRPDGVEPPAAWEAILRALTGMHAAFWGQDLSSEAVGWCPWEPRIKLLSPSNARRLAAEGIDFGASAGWDAFERIADPAVRSVITRMFENPAPVLNAMERLPATLLHADAKIGNMGLERGVLWLFDWADVTVGPIGLEVGHLLAVNSSRLPWSHNETLARYAGFLERQLAPEAFAACNWPVQEALAVLTGFMVLGWAKAAEAEAGSREEFDWWCARSCRRLTP
jgi:hypothetical protein